MAVASSASPAQQDPNVGRCFVARFLPTTAAALVALVGLTCGPHGVAQDHSPQSRAHAIPQGHPTPLPPIYMAAARATGPSPPAPQPSTRSQSQVRIPLAGVLPPDAVSVDRGSGLVTIVVRDTPLGDILSTLAVQHGLNLICSEDIASRVSVTLHQVPFDEALTQVLAVAGYTWVRQGNILIVTSTAANTNVSPQLQGRHVRVFQLDYVAAVDVDLVIQGLLSPVGQSFVSEAMDTDNRRTQELVTVEDLPPYLCRIEDYIRQVDLPPRQVLIEAHVLSIDLDDDLKLGLNLEYLDSITPSVTLRTQGLADIDTFTKAKDPAFFFNLAAGDLKMLLEALETTTDAKTLATPKVLALNGQQARVQVGKRLGYRITTTTQTSSLESVEFLDVGVVLTVTPRITAEGAVMMQVKPQVSKGDITLLGLPEEETTEVETALLLPDGHGMLIGGLIQEFDTEKQSKVPWLGDLWMVGKLFQLNTKKRKRTEIVIALVPHIVPYGPDRQRKECEQFQRATTPLLYGPLNQMPRPYEPRFPDANQCLPLNDKLHRMKTLPDGGAWTPEYWPQRCVPGGPPVPTLEPIPFGSMSGEYFPAEAPEPSNREVIPTPLPAARE
jgi:type IV pilus assembly protein PilQ